MLTRVLIAFVVLLFASDDGADEGRRGNTLYEEQAYEKAAAAYRAGLDRIEGEAGITSTALWNNLGAALHQQERYEEAAAAFQNALDVAATPGHRARVLYNAGNTAAAQNRRQAALDFYRKALLADPAYEDARFNYEYLKRQMENPRGRQQASQEPTRQQQRHRSHSQDGASRQSPSQNRSSSSPQNPTRRRETEPSPQQNSSADRAQQDGTPAEKPTRRDPSSTDPQDGSSGAASASERNGEAKGPELSPEQAARILRALESQEKQLLRQVQKRKPRARRIEKEW